VRPRTNAFVGRAPWPAWSDVLDSAGEERSQGAPRGQGPALQLGCGDVCAEGDHGGAGGLALAAAQGARLSQSVADGAGEQDYDQVGAGVQGD